MLCTLRLISRTWIKATVDLKAFSGCLKVKMQTAEAKKLAKLCQKYPNTSSLELESWDNLCDVSPITKCTGLTRLVINCTSEYCPEGNHNWLDLALLPSGLRELTTDGWGYEMESLQDFKSVGITGLHLTATDHSLTDICKILQHLPGLEVKTFSYLLLESS